MNTATDYSNDFMKYRGPNTSSYPSYTTNATSANLNDHPILEQPSSSWLHGTDFNSLAGDLFTTKDIGTTGDISYGNLTGINMNLDQIKIGDQTMENVLKALDPSGPKQSNTYNSNSNDYSYDYNKTGYNKTGYNSADYTKTGYNNTFNNNNTSNAFLNGLNLDSSFTMKPKSSSTNFDYLKPTNRSNIIKSHTSNPQAAGKVSFQHPPTSQFFSSPDESFVNMTLPAMDTSLIFSDKRSVGRTNGGLKNSGNYPASVPSYSANSQSPQDQREKEQFVSFAVQQYRMLAGLNPEMMREPENLEELADRETFKYWAKLFIEERERQARIVLNMQKALTEALSGSAAKGPNVMAHLGAASGDFELETIGKYADQCRKRSQIISNYFNNKK